MTKLLGAWCQVGRHAPRCDGAAWNENTGTTDNCQCDCHTTETETEAAA